MLEGTLGRLEAQRAAIEAELESASDQLALFKEDVAVAWQLEERGVTNRAARRESERALADLRGTRASLAARLTEAAAAEAEARLQRADADTKRISAVSEELATVTARQAEIAPALAAVAQRIARSDVVAPVSGIVVGLSVVTIGGVIAPGEPVMDIVPEGAALVAQARVRLSDRERLRAGMTGEVRLAAVENRPDATLDGTVARISADRVEATPDEEEGY